MFRIHPANEDPNTCKDANRPTGWIHADQGEEEIPGVAAMWSLAELVEYADHYGMIVAADDQLLEIHGAVQGDGHDGCDVYVVADDVEVIGTGADFLEICELVRIFRDESVEMGYGTDAAFRDFSEMVEEMTEDGDELYGAMARAAELVARHRSVMVDSDIFG